MIYILAWLGETEDYILSTVSKDGVRYISKYIEAQDKSFAHFLGTEVGMELLSQHLPCKYIRVSG